MTTIINVLWNFNVVCICYDIHTYLSIAIKHCPSVLLIVPLPGLLYWFQKAGTTTFEPNRQSCGWRCILGKLNILEFCEDNSCFPQAFVHCYCLVNIILFHLCSLCSHDGWKETLFSMLDFHLWISFCVNGYKIVNLVCW